MEKDQCFACVNCDFMTYSSINMEQHIKIRHDGMPVKYDFKRVPEPMTAVLRQIDVLLNNSRHISTQPPLEDGAKKLASGSESEKVEISQSNSGPDCDFRADMTQEESKPCPMKLFNSHPLDESHNVIPHIKPDPDNIKQEIPEPTLDLSDHDCIALGHKDLKMDDAANPFICVDAQSSTDEGNRNTIEWTSDHCVTGSRNGQNHLN